MTVRVMVAASAFTAFAALAISTQAPATNTLIDEGSAEVVVTESPAVSLVDLVEPWEPALEAPEPVEEPQPVVIPDRYLPDAGEIQEILDTMSVEDKICWAFGEQCERAVRIAWCESRHLPDAEGQARERGLFQIHPVHQAWIGDYGFTWDDMYKVDPNIQIAKVLYDEQGWKPWTCTG